MAFRNYINLFLFLCFYLLFGSAHSQKGYVKFRYSATVLGTTRGIMKGMEDAGYNAKGVRSWLGGNTDYPNKSKVPSIYIEGGLYIKEKRSLSVLIGLEDMGEVDGRSYSGYDAHVGYKGYVFNPRLNFHKNVSAFGFGPTLMLYKWADYVNSANPGKGSNLIPGISISTEVLFKGKRRFSVGVFSTLNLYTSSTIHIVPSSANSGSGFETKINPTNLQAGLFFRFGK